MINLYGGRKIKDHLEHLYNGPIKIVKEDFHCQLVSHPNEILYQT